MQKLSSLKKGQHQSSNQMKSNQSVNSFSSTSSTSKSYDDKVNQFTITDYVKKISVILKEQIEMFFQFNLMLKNCQSLEQVFDIFEAISYELTHRIEQLKELQNVIAQSLIPQKSQEIGQTRYDEIEVHQVERIEPNQFYDWVLDIDTLKNIQTKGWKFYFSNSEIQKGVNVKAKKDGAVVAVLGLYDKGKTFVLNQLTNQSLPSSKKVSTKGLSFKTVLMDSGTSLVLIDTAGCYSPVKIEQKSSISEKELTEQFIVDLTFEISDYFICVVNDFTSLDQRYLDKISRNLIYSSKVFKEIIVIHNMKDVDNPHTLEFLWNQQVTTIFQNLGSLQKTKVAAINPFNNELQEKQVEWFKTQYSRHVCLTNEQSSLGLSMNPWVISLVKYWLKAVFVPFNRKFQLMDTVIKHCELKISGYLRKSVSLEILPTNIINEQILAIKDPQQNNSKVKDTQLNKSVDMNGMLINNYSHKFEPLVDIVQTDSYNILVELPGVSKEEIELYRQNVITIVRGYKKKHTADDDHIVRQERKYGDFELKFKIPQEYEKKWNIFQLENGLLQLSYRKDEDD